MKERPLLFQPAMVRSVLRDINPKNQTRRICKLEVRAGMSEPELASLLRCCPYGQPGDRLWVRETFSGPWCMEAGDGIAAAPPSKWARESRIWYWADGEPTHGDWTRPRPSIHMPRWASRITLEVTEVRVERLQDISEADAIAEGIYGVWVYGEPRFAHSDGVSFLTAADAYRDLWASINGDGSWDANPWVWVVGFRRLP